MNAKVFQTWFENFWYKHTDEEERRHTIMFLDSYVSTHKSYSPADTSVYFFPPNSTSLLQPMDLVLNKPFKDRIRIFWEEWMAEDANISLTKSSYRKSVPRETFIDWVKPGIKLVKAQLETPFLISEEE